MLVLRDQGRLVLRLRIGRVVVRVTVRGPPSVSTVRVVSATWTVTVRPAVIRRATELADWHALRGYDAGHCASAERIDGPDLVIASGDEDVLAACSELAPATALIGQ